MSGFRRAFYDKFYAKKSSVRRFLCLIELLLCAGSGIGLGIAPIVGTTGIASKLRAYALKTVFARQPSGDADKPQAQCDILVVGGGTGGTAAAIAAAESGAKVDLLEESDWFGGQLTAQGVSTLDEHQYMEAFGGTSRYYRFREGVRAYYRAHYRLTSEAATRSRLDAGRGWAGPFGYEPKVGMAVLKAMALPLEQSGRLHIFYHTRIVGTELDARTGNTITSVVAQSSDGVYRRFRARYVLDATELGDVLALSGREGADWTVGAEGRAETQEPDAPDKAHPEWVQPLTFPFALDWSPDTQSDNVVLPPKDYQQLKAQQRYSLRYGAITGLFKGRYPWWTYRRMLASFNLDKDVGANDLVMVNTPGNDFRGGNLIGSAAVSDAKKQNLQAQARRASLGYIYWLQTECPREDDPTGRRRGYPEFRLRRDVFDTADGLALQPYIRESRRIRALRPILEQEIVARDGHGQPHQSAARAAFMPDSVGVGCYPVDIHTSDQGDPRRYLPTRPFQIPLGALIPVRLDNLLPAGKNLGTTHLTNGAYRVQPLEWNIGESAGLLATYCLRTGMTPRAVYSNLQARRAFQTALLGEGIPLCWFIDVSQGHPAFVAVQRLAMAGVPIANAGNLRFHPKEVITT